MPNPNGDRNPDALNYAQMVDAIHAIPRDVPLHVRGGPGIGKTTSGKEAEEADGGEWVTWNAVTMDVSDAGGVPSVNDASNPKFMVMRPFEIMYMACEPEGPPLSIIIDDIGMARSDVQGVLMHVLLERRPPNSRLQFRNNTRFILTSNRKEDAAGVQAMVTPIRAGRAVFLELAPDLAEWTPWHAKKYPHFPDVRDFLAVGDHVRYFSPHAAGFGRDELTGIPCPRSWELVTKLQIQQAAVKTPDWLFERLVRGTVGADAGSAFVVWMRQRVRMPAASLVLDPATVQQAIDAIQLTDAAGNVVSAVSSSGQLVPQIDPALAVSLGKSVVDLAHRRMLQENRNLTAIECAGFITYLFATHRTSADAAKAIIQYSRETVPGMIDHQPAMAVVIDKLENGRKS